MPKFRSHSGAKKRFRLSASGKVKHGKMNKAHILTKKRQKKKRQFASRGLSSQRGTSRINAYTNTKKTITICI